MREPWIYNGIRSDHVLPDITTTIEQVKSLIKEIDISKSKNISSNIMKDAFESIPTLLTTF